MTSILEKNSGPEYHSTTTLRAIRAASPCDEGWIKLLKHLGKTKADDEPLDLLTVLNSNGLDDALWVLSYGAPDCERLARHYQAWCVDQVLPIFEAECPNDSRVRDQIAMLRNDDATYEEREAARAAAWSAARAAAGDAAWAAAWSAAWSAARAAARAAAGDAAGDAAWAAQGRQLRKMLTLHVREVIDGEDNA
ncbi:hypothetical protein JWJ88_17165 [Paracoccus methylovorus]|uniref:Uncharacterized protein n=1 Tax=Paracoccus methylovorus TaxID=2812658 RepID=A0ABX7JNZ6_9RHOB|nr:hypothetical protein [Paracoccus methylovorus]QRZ14694.1 hypothetical protein JWJ88_17165 [Paracoccus methylovorus]